MDSDINPAIIFAGIIGLIGALRWYSQGRPFTKKVSIKGKVVLITGANTGIGKATALDLARRGGTIYIGCRSVARGETARNEIIKQSGNQNVHFLQMDLSSFDSIRSAVKRFLEKEKHLHILINNAGLVTAGRETTCDGLEMQMGVNHFAPFLLTNLLLDTMKKSAPSRIVNVSSVGHYRGIINKEDLQSENGAYHRLNTYLQSKLANVLFTRELAKRLEGTAVTANSLHPGVVRTELARNLTLITILLYPFTWLQRSVTAGAQTSIMVSVDPDLVNVSGKYFSDCCIKEESYKAKDDKMARWLWMKSEQLTKLYNK